MIRNGITESIVFEVLQSFACWTTREPLQIRIVGFSNSGAIIFQRCGWFQTDCYAFGIVSRQHLLMHVPEQFTLPLFVNSPSGILRIWKSGKWINDMPFL